MRRIDLIKLKIRELSVNVLLLLFVVVLFFVFAEVFVRLFVGSHIFGKIDDNSLYHFEPNQDGWYSPPFPTARINNIGARGPDVDVDSLRDKYVFLGDSYMFGWCVEDDETIPYYFRNYLNLSDNEVINFGMGGYGVDDMIVRHDMEKDVFYPHDIFIMSIIEIDFFRKMYDYRPSFVIRVYRAVKRHSSFVAYLRIYYRQFFANVLCYLFGEEEQVRELYVDYVGKVDVFTESNMDKLLSFNVLLEENNQTLIFVFYEYNFTNYSRKADLFCKENNLNCITDVPSCIDKIRGSREIRAADGGHPSNYSNEVVARRIAEYVEGKKFKLLSR